MEFIVPICSRTITHVIEMRNYSTYVKLLELLSVLKMERGSERKKGLEDNKAFNLFINGPKLKKTRSGKGRSSN